MSDKEAKVLIVDANARNLSGNSSEPSNGRSRRVRTQCLAQIPVAAGPAKAPARKGTGPRTKLGKQQSCRNSLKHGIFSSVLLLDRESEAEYQLLATGLRTARQPQGVLEESLVESLAMLTWRKRRVLEAERGEIARVAEFAKSDWSITQRKQLDEVMDIGTVAGGLLHGCSNPYVLDNCIEMLRGMRWNLKNNGFHAEHDSRLLERIYGLSSSGRPSYGFFSAYTTLAKGAENALSETADKTNDAYKEAVNEATNRLDQEIKRLRFLRKYYFDLEMRRAEYIEQAAMVPSSGISERLLRYEAHLNREIDRTMRQLERSQRMRSGETVPPSIHVEVSR